MYVVDDQSMVAWIVISIDVPSTWTGEMGVQRGYWKASLANTPSMRRAAQTIRQIYWSVILIYAERLQSSQLCISAVASIRLKSNELGMPRMPLLVKTFVTRLSHLVRLGIQHTCRFCYEI